MEANVSFNPPPRNTSTPVGTAGGHLDSNLLLQMMMRRDEEQRRERQEQREEMRVLRQEMLRMHEDRRSSEGSGSSVLTIQEFSRRANRCFQDVRESIEKLNSIMENSQDAESIQSVCDVLTKNVDRFGEFFENKIDLLDGTPAKDYKLEGTERQSRARNSTRKNNASTAQRSGESRAVAGWSQNPNVPRRHDALSAMVGRI